MVDDYDKAIISLAVLVGAALISVIVAKLVDICYDRASISDDASDVSEHTRNLIRARLTVMKFRSKKNEKAEKSPAEAEEDKQKNAVKVLRLWSAKSRIRKLSARQPDLEAGKNPDEKAKAESTENGTGEADTTKNSAAVEPGSKGTGPSTNVDPKTIHSILKSNKMPTVVTVDETAKTENAKMPKSALVTNRPKSALATTTNTAGKTTALNADTQRPKSGVKRVTITEPSSKSVLSVNSLARSASAVKVSLQDVEEGDHPQGETTGVTGESRDNKRPEENVENKAVQQTEKSWVHQEEKEGIKSINDKLDETSAGKPDEKTTNKENGKTGNKDDRNAIQRIDENGRITEGKDRKYDDRTDEMTKGRTEDETVDKTDDNETNRIDEQTRGEIDKIDKTDEKTTIKSNGKTADENFITEKREGKSAGKRVGKSTGRKDEKPRGTPHEKLASGNKIRGKSVTKAEMKPSAQGPQKPKRKPKAERKTNALHRVDSDDLLMVPFKTNKKAKDDDRPSYVHDIESDSSEDYEFLSAAKLQKKK